MEKFEDLNLSVQQEIVKEDHLALLLETCESKEDTKSIIADYKELAENSNNGRTAPIILKCIDTLNKGFISTEIKHEISNGISKELFPLLYKKILSGEEKISSERLLEMGLNIYDVITQEDVAGKELESSFMNLFHLIDPNTKQKLFHLINERTNRED